MSWLVGGAPLTVQRPFYAKAFHFKCDNGIWINGVPVSKHYENESSVGNAIAGEGDTTVASVVVDTSFNQATVTINNSTTAKYYNSAGAPFAIQLPVSLAPAESIIFTQSMPLDTGKSCLVRVGINTAGLITFIPLLATNTNTLAFFETGDWNSANGKPWLVGSFSYRLPRNV